MSRKNILIVVGVVVLGAAVVAANFYFKKDKGLAVTTEQIRTRDLEAVVSASGKIQAERTVNVSSDTVGRVVNLAVNEGDRVTKGQFLLQIDPKTLRSRVDNGEASVKAAEVTLEQMRQSVETGKAQLELARQNLKRQQDLWEQQLTTRETLDKAVNDVKVADSSLSERDKTANAQASRIAQERANLDSAEYDLSKVRIVSPIDGIVTARSIQEGEMVMIGTMNNAGTVLMTLADMSTIQAEIEVDETSVPSVQLGQKAKITIDAIPDKSFSGHVTEIGNSPIQTATTGTTGTQATNFKVKVVLDEIVPNVRPGFTCTADITTATRKSVVSVPIPAVAVRELVYDANGQVVKAPKADKRKRTPEPTASAAELKPGQTRKETEGVFVVRNNAVEFVPIKMGIAGDKYFEVLSGLKDGDQVVTGPYNSVRGMADGDLVKLDNGKKK
ncbi:MAG TPA: efflux RND transporter periplasmic adaptor subunit [Vicinamibacterales bacterium]|jgi:HlyD family secretion protein|nr:efflux RND transporter periplasmic adaptor subunit [Vicinamibacterales bacterium]